MNGLLALLRAPSAAVEVATATPSETWRADMPCARCGWVTHLSFDFKLNADARKLLENGAAFGCHCQQCGGQVMGMFRRVG